MMSIVQEPPGSESERRRPIWAPFITNEQLRRVRNLLAPLDADEEMKGWGLQERRAVELVKTLILSPVARLGTVVGRVGVECGVGGVLAAPSAWVAMAMPYEVMGGSGLRPRHGLRWHACGACADVENESSLDQRDLSGPCGRRVRRGRRVGGSDGAGGDGDAVRGDGRLGTKVPLWAEVACVWSLRRR